jgi:hypothetical protein
MTSRKHATKAKPKGWSKGKSVSTQKPKSKAPTPVQRHYGTTTRQTRATQSAPIEPSEVRIFSSTMSQHIDINTSFKLIRMKIWMLECRISNHEIHA